MTGPAAIGQLAEAGAVRLARGLHGVGRVVIRMGSALVSWVARRQCRRAWDAGQTERGGSGRAGGAS